MKKRFAFILLAGVVLCSCAQPGNDYSKVQAQTGGPEQGEWRDKQGTLLSLNNGQFSYQKGATKMSGTYSVEGGKIALSGDVGGGNMTAQWPDQNGPLTLNGEQLTKTD